MSGVAHMHTKMRMQHRDIKPDNVLLKLVLQKSPENDPGNAWQVLQQVVVGDLGAAEVVEDEDGRLPDGSGM